MSSATAATEKWSEWQGFHLRSPGPRPGALKTEPHSEKLADSKGIAPSTYPQTTGCSAIELRVRKMVGSAGNAPVRHFQFCFATPGLQSGNWITSQSGRGSGSHTHLKKLMRLPSVHSSSFPHWKLVEPVGNAPTSTCLQGRCIACLPRPQF